ncbi:MAG: tetratricopeptide repeat protein, partial [Archaeoglobaceae archaeon]
IAFEILKKMFESPESAEKYLVLLRDNPNAILIATKIAESVGRYLSSEDEDKCLNIFLRAIEYMMEIKDRKSVYNIFEIVKEAIESRIALGKYESASKLVKIFLNLGMNTYVKKLMFHAIEVSESGDFARALRILNDLPQNDDVLTTKAYILLEWGKNIASRDPQLGLSKIEEALKLKELQSAKVAMAEIYENIGNYARAYEIYSSMRDRPGIATKLARLLMEWGEEEGDPKKLEEVKLIVNDPVMLEEIDRRIRKIMDQRVSGS